jgi:tetratricopeptide (TPR) repeat protein
MAEFDELTELLANALAGGGNKPVSVASLLAEAAEARRNGDLTATLALYDRAIDQDPDCIDAWLGRSATLRGLGRQRDALASCLSVVERNPANVAARSEMARILVTLGRTSEAHAIGALLVREQPESPDHWHDAALVLAATGHSAAAAACLRRALALAPAHTPARLALARLLADGGEHEAAADAFHDAILLEPGAVDAHVGLCASLIARHQVDEAEDRLERALMLDDTHAEAYLTRAHVRLLRGDLAGACSDAAWRHRLPGAFVAEFPGEAWDGGPVEGQLLLLHGEGNAADTIQMARTLRPLAQAGARMVLMVEAGLVELLRPMEGVELVLPLGHALPETCNPDLYASLLDLPLLTGTRLSHIPGDVPYLTAPAELSWQIPAPPGTQVKAGLAWAGTTTLPFEHMLGLTDVPGVAAFSLQTGPAARELTTQAHPCLIADIAPATTDFAALAASIAHLDLVITADGPVAHLAAALGKPVWLLLPYSPDPRWMLGRDDSPWYPTLRLFRQDRPGDWLAVFARVHQALEELTRQAEKAQATALGQACGARVALRAMLDAHLQAGDLLIDVDAGDGTFTLDAAAHVSGDVRVLALEPHAAEAEILRDSVAIAGAEDLVEVVASAAGDRFAPVVVARRPRRGRRVFSLPDWLPAAQSAISLDSLMAERPELAERRLLLRLGQAGWESAILDGLWEWLAMGRIAVVILEHREGSGAAEDLGDFGFSLWRFPTEAAFGTMVSFSGEPGPVLALAPGLDVLAHYGATNLPATAATVATARDQARRLAAEGLAEFRASRRSEAGRLYAQALALDPFSPEANTNMGVLLHTDGHNSAAAACCRRAGIRAPAAAASTNLGSLLRTLGRTAEAEAVQLEALAAEPDNAVVLFNLAMVRRDQGDARAAAALLERVRQLRPEFGWVGWEHAQAVAAAGNLGAAFALFNHRPKPPSPLPGIPPWNGASDDLAARSLLVYDEGDATDTIMLSRFIPQIARRGALVTLECLPELVPLLTGLTGVELVVPRGQDIPACDLSVALSELPRLLGTTGATLPRTVPYLGLPEGMGTVPVRRDGGLRVGLAWNGRPQGRACPLAEMLALAANPAVTLVGLQRGAAAAKEIAASGATVLIDDRGAGNPSLAEVAATIAGLDLVVAGDCVEAHLAGAMGRPVWVLLPVGADWRWPDGHDSSPWYPTMRVFRQQPDGSWRHPIARMRQAMEVMAASRERC